MISRLITGKEHILCLYYLYDITYNDMLLRFFLILKYKKLSGRLEFKSKCCFLRLIQIVSLKKDPSFCSYLICLVYHNYKKNEEISQVNMFNLDLCRNKSYYINFIHKNMSYLPL